MGLSNVQRTTFEPLIDDEFVLRTDDGQQATVRLVGVTPLKGARQEREPFSLLFRGPGEAHFPQQTFTLTHDRTGALPIFMVPVGREGEPASGPLLYQAIFS